MLDIVNYTEAVGKHLHDITASEIKAGLGVMRNFRAIEMHFRLKTPTKSVAWFLDDIESRLGWFRNTSDE